MSKIVRYQGDVRAFASDAQGMERTVFGGTNQADDLTSQITASFLRGWGIVGASEHPSLEDFNAAMYAMSQFIAYQHQMGVPEWHAEQEYHIGSICTHNGESYQSLQNANIGSQPPSAKWTPVLTSKNGLANLGLSDRLVFDISGTSIQSPNGRYTVFANDDGTWGAWDNVNKRQVPLDLTRGGFGGINAAEARTNLELKAAAQRDVGTSAGQIPDMSSFGATKNGTGTFYLPNGIIVKWGTAHSTGTKGNAPYPTPFPNDTYAAIICHASASDSTHYTAGVMNPSRLGFDFSTAPTQSTGASFYYIAIGY
ncbi:hypothetical protein [Citrobacter portucalensis]|uniref:gp53-like domain-containing protein n=1 Tax=Citrobacter portucalensis TaxID=1639133 RepID=UPI003A836AF7